MNKQRSSKQQPTIYLGIDTGGTFTDFVLLQNGELSIHKVLSTPEAPERAIMQGIRELDLAPMILAGQVRVIHGSTVATNAALEGKGAVTALVTNEGFKDILTIGRQTRAELYNLQPLPAKPPIATEYCFEVSARIDASGQEIKALSSADVERVKQQLEQSPVEAVAVVMLFAHLNNTHEKILGEALGEHWFVSESAAVLPESGEYERGIATWLNASLGPKVHSYIQSLKQQLWPSPLAIMQSTGGTIDADFAAQNAARLLLSGPAGGLAAARFIGQQMGVNKLLTFDMGGTSTDVAVIDGDILLTNEGRIGSWPVAVPQVDMHTIGAGGGSIARVDSAGLLMVGPESAAAKPGPACYGHGGTEATVTDANVVLGRLQADYFLGGAMKLNNAAATSALQALGQQLKLSAVEAAHGVIRLANEHMARALRVISIERGYDLQRFQLCCFGGAGGLHVCALAETLGIKQAIVPRMGGVLSAMGMVVAPKTRELSCSHSGLLQEQSLEQLQNQLEELVTRGTQELIAEGASAATITAHRSADIRYHGQRFYLNIPWQNDLNQIEQAFAATHASRYGHRLAANVEIVNLRVRVSAPASVNNLPRFRPTSLTSSITPINQVIMADYESPISVYSRDQLAPGQMITGPALVVETVATTFVAKGWSATQTEWGHLQLRR